MDLIRFCCYFLSFWTIFYYFIIYIFIYSLWTENVQCICLNYHQFYFFLARLFSQFFSPSYTLMLLCVIIRFFAFILLCECFFFFVLVRFSFHLHCLFTSHVRIVSLVTFFISFIYFFASFSAISLRKRVYEFSFFSFLFLACKYTINWIYASASLSAGNELQTHTRKSICTLYIVQHYMEWWHGVEVQSKYNLWACILQYD